MTFAVTIRTLLNLVHEKVGADLLSFADSDSPVVLLIYPVRQRRVVHCGIVRGSEKATRPDQVIFMGLVLRYKENCLIIMT